MPRTKAVRKKPITKTSKAAQILQNCKQAALSAFEQDIDNFIVSLRRSLVQTKLAIDQSIASKTVAEMRELPLNWSESDSTSTSVLHILNATKSMTAKKQRTLRSSSVGDDEGYITAGSSKSTSGGGRPSRTRGRTGEKTKRVSRSASAHVKPSDKFKTPVNKLPPPTYGTVTPKVKPNTPQIVLRRPNIGEVALSFQGSPLMTGAITTDTMANINIPLDDGRLLSIQPQRGLRMSQIPSLNLETRRQLETLRDNLNKVCALASKK